MVGCLWGCGGNRSDVLQKAEGKVTQIEDKIQNSDEKKQKEAAGMVYATELALDKAESSKPVELARGFNDRAQTLIGVPEPADAKQLRQLVSDLLSQLDQERERGSQALEELDAKLAKMTAEKEKLQRELAVAEKKCAAVSYENAVLADKEQKRKANWWNPFYDLSLSLKKFLAWGIIILCLLFALPVLAAFFPVLLPMVSGIGAVIGKGIGWLMEMVPGAISGAGLIGKKIFDLVDGTKNRLVSAIEDWQKEQKLTGQADYKDLAKHLASVLDVEHKNVVSEAKQQMAP